MDKNQRWEHRHSAAQSSAEIATWVSKVEKSGFELVSVTFDGESWVAFVKRDLAYSAKEINGMLREIEAGISSIASNTI